MTHRRAQGVAPTMQRRFGTIAPSGRGVVLSAMHPAVRSARSLFPSRVFDADEVGRVLKDGHQSRKIGRTITKGARKGWPIFTLTLEERATCPASCAAYSVCYGNNMQAAERIEHGPALLVALERELGELAVRHPQGFLVRLHVLGDFYSEEYVEFWQRMLHAIPALHIFGFTAHLPSSVIGRRVALVMCNLGWKRFAIRFSGLPHELHAAVLLETGEAPSEGVIVCPAQTRATDCCATCGLCWHSERSIGFRRH